MGLLLTGSQLSLVVLSCVLISMPAFDVCPVNTKLLVSRKKIEVVDRLRSALGGTFRRDFCRRTEHAHTDNSISSICVLGITAHK